MAQVDTGIYSNLLARPKSVEEFDNEAQAAKANQLSLLLQKSQYDQQQRGVAEDGAFRAALSQGGDFNDAGVQQRLIQASPTKGMAFIKGQADTKKAQSDAIKAQRDAEKEKIANARSQIELIGQVAGSAKDQASYTQGLQMLQAQGIDVSEIPPQFNPQYVSQALQQAITAKDQLEEVWKAKKFDLDERQFGETVRNNKAQTAVSMRGQDITMRGQNMTDSRSRESNALKYDENNIKRGEKKATEDLTKSSQVASFDTMLGTLDRLGKHPGLSRSVGVTGAFPTMPGSDSANFQAELNTFQSQAFLPMVAQLKGMGALSDAEGKKLTAAVGALDPKMGEDAFRASVARIADDMEAARERVSGVPRPKKPDPAPPGPAAPKVGLVKNGYRFKGGNPASQSSWEKVN